VVACFTEDCTVELLGVRLAGHDGVRRWLSWVFGRVERLRFEPRLITVAGAELVEEFVVAAVLHGGKVVRSRWAEVLTYRDGLVASLRLYFDPLDFAEALGLPGKVAGGAARRMARRGLEPFELLD
jgi:ketosteroid isomerase-like protein